MTVHCTASNKRQLCSASRDLTEDRSINLQYTNDQLLLKLFICERCIYLPVCTEIITRIIVLDWIGFDYAETATRQSFCGLALRRTSIDLVHHGEQQRRPANDRRS